MVILNINTTKNLVLTLALIASLGAAQAEVIGTAVNHQGGEITLDSNLGGADCPAVYWRVVTATSPDGEFNGGCWRVYQNKIHVLYNSRNGVRLDEPFQRLYNRADFDMTPFGGLLIQVMGTPAKS